MLVTVYGTRLVSAAVAVVATPKVASGGLTTSDYLGIASLTITVVAVGIAVYQTIKTRGAAEATKQSVKSTLGKLARDETLGLIGDLQRIDRDLQGAIDAGHSANAVGDRLADWRDKASGLWQLVPADQALSDLRDRLNESVKVAAELKSKLPKEVDKLPGATGDLREIISRVCGELAMLELKVRYETKEDA